MPSLSVTINEDRAEEKARKNPIKQLNHIIFIGLELPKPSLKPII